MKYLDPICDKFKSLNEQLRDLNLWVTSDDYTKFIAMNNHQDHCYLCGEDLLKSINLQLIVSTTI